MKRKSIKDKSENNAPSVADLGPLPKSDRNAELERISLAALHAFLPADRFLFRDERTSDAGVECFNRIVDRFRLHWIAIIYTAQGY